MPEMEVFLAEEAAAVSKQATGYMKPPQEIIDLVDIPPEPNLSFSPDRTKVLQLYKPSPLPPISELARRELKLAGKCFKPAWRQCPVLVVVMAHYSWHMVSCI